MRLNEEEKKFLQEVFEIPNIRNNYGTRFRVKDRANRYSHGNENHMSEIEFKWLQGEIELLKKQGVHNVDANMTKMLHRFHAQYVTEHTHVPGNVDSGAAHRGSILGAHETSHIVPDTTPFLTLIDNLPSPRSVGGGINAGQGDSIPGGITYLDWASLSTREKQMLIDRVERNIRTRDRLVKLAQVGGALITVGGLAASIMIPTAEANKGRLDTAFSEAKEKNQELYTDCLSKIKQQGCKTKNCTISSENQPDNDLGCGEICRDIYAHCEAQIALNERRGQPGIYGKKQPAHNEKNNYWPKADVINRKTGEKQSIWFPQMTKYGDELAWGKEGCGRWYLDPATNLPNYDYVLDPKSNQTVDENYQYPHIDPHPNLTNVKNSNWCDAGTLNSWCPIFSKNTCLSICDHPDAAKSKNDCDGNKCEYHPKSGDVDALCITKCGGIKEQDICKANSGCHWNSTKSCWPNPDLFSRNVAVDMCKTRDESNCAAAGTNTAGVPWCKYSTGYCVPKPCSLFESKADCETTNDVKKCLPIHYDDYLTETNRVAAEEICSQETTCGAAKRAICKAKPKKDANGADITPPTTADYNCMFIGNDNCAKTKVFVKHSSGNLEDYQCQWQTNSDSYCEEKTFRGGGHGNCNWKPQYSYCERVNY